MCFSHAIDASSNRKILERALNNKVNLCETSCDGSEAVAKVQEKGLNFYSIIFMDNLMPNMDGMTATKLLRQSGYTGLIVGVTGSAMESEISLFESVGADCVMSKPLPLEQLDRFITYCNKNGTETWAQKTFEERNLLKIILTKNTRS